jgi:hypothetical protein
MHLRPETLQAAGTTGVDGAYAACGLYDGAALKQELLASVMDPNRWKRNCDQAYRERVCRGSKHDMPRWCKGSAGPGGKFAHDLDDAEKSWIEQAGRRQESKQTLLVNHKAYLKEARIQVCAMLTQHAHVAIRVNDAGCAV